VLLKYLLTYLLACTVVTVQGLLCCEMETCTNKGVSCFIHNSDKHRQYYVKKNKNVCWRCTQRAKQEL